MTDLGTTTYPSPGTGSPAGTSGSSTDSNGVKEKADELTGRAADTRDTAVQAGSEVAQTAADKAKDVAAETQRQARNLAGEARDQLQTQVQQQHQNLVSQLRSLAEQLNSMASAGQGEGGPAGIAQELVGQAGDRAQQLVSHLEHRQPTELVDDVRRFARQHPGTFLAGAALAGVVAGRLTRGAVAAKQDDSSDGVSSGSAAGARGGDYGTPTYSSRPTPSTGSIGGSVDTGGSIGTDVGVGYQPTTPHLEPAPGYATGTQTTGYSTPAVGEPVQQYPGGAGYQPGDAR